MNKTFFKVATALSFGVLATQSNADQVFADDVIVQFSLCTGNDCANGESFGFDTLRLKENNLRIHADDTSNSASFPQNDWRILFNETGNGGRNYFAVEDSTAGRIPFTVEAGAPANSLIVEQDGDVGIGIEDPIVNVHVVDGNSPTLRLQQDGSAGFNPQIFDIASNEANFFVRDVTNGSQLPFRIEPGADTNALYIDSTNNIGMGTNAPSQPLHIRGTAAGMFIENVAGSTGARSVMNLTNNGRPDIIMANAGTGREWSFGGGTNFVMKTGTLGSTDAAKTKHFDLNGNTGNLTITGTITTAGSCSGGCDLVFEEDYDLMSIEDRAELMFKNKYLPNVGATPENGPFNLSEKVGGILNELEHAHIYIAQLNERISMLEAQLGEQ